MLLDFINTNQNLLEDLFDDLKKVSIQHNSHNNIMQTDIIEAKDHYLLIINVPGLTKEDIKISFDSDNKELSIEAFFPSYLKQDQEKNKEANLKINYLRKERPSMHIKRSFSIGRNLTMKDDIKGKVSNGVLEIMIKKIDEPKKEKQYLKLE
ncbi:putative Hsp20 family chaperone [Candidatus Phytoplasma oryzae]|uniref:Putative Hsp20 family chaperone n=1 Tax=Candidatus Phytoplasma oryzae TaxID=203274 RepID=A0A139JQC9_9MOLU|nr:Hsp20/alpha crystallin family protein [Candidatus Phytoplasma oryzae]KXT29172.1 putative Hsp20 family chaperone [Candidatus Phytoplasma oryzae]